MYDEQQEMPSHVSRALSGHVNFNQSETPGLQFMRKNIRGTLNSSCCEGSCKTTM